MRVRALNQTRQTSLADGCEIAQSFTARFFGLMGRSALPPQSGLLIAPCSSIHMFFMQFAIDAIFLDRHGVVVGLTSNLAPWAPYAGARGARAVIELPTGTIAASHTERGDQIVFDPPLPKL